MILPAQYHRQIQVIMTSSFTFRYLSVTRIYYANRKQYNVLLFSMQHIMKLKINIKFRDTFNPVQLNQ